MVGSGLNAPAGCSPAGYESGPGREERRALGANGGGGLSLPSCGPMGPRHHEGYFLPFVVAGPFEQSRHIQPYGRAFSASARYTIAEAVM